MTRACDVIMLGAILLRIGDIDLAADGLDAKRSIASRQIGIDKTARQRGLKTM